MNNLQHGLFSNQDLIEGESSVERQELVDEITAAAKPSDGIERLLTERMIKTAWKIRRGERAQEARAAKLVNATVEGAAAREARRAEALGAVLDDKVEVAHELCTFPAGVAYLLQEWSIILKSLNDDVPLMASTRLRCFSLNGKTREQVLRSDRVATKWFLGLAGLMYGTQITVDDIIALLGTDPPEWMQETEFAFRAELLRRQVPAQAAAREKLTGYVTKVMKRLKKELKYVQAVADRDLRLDATEAAADVTPAGTSLANKIDKLDRSCMASLRRLEARQKKSGRPGLERDLKTAATAVEAVDGLGEPGWDQQEVVAAGADLNSAPAAAAVAADAEASLAPEVTPDDPAPVTATEATDCRVEPISEPTAIAAVAEECWVEPISEPTALEAVAEECRVEPTSEPTAIAAVAEECRVEPTSVPIPSAAGAARCEVEGDCVHGGTAPDFERFGPEADRLRRLRRHLEATGGTDGPGPDSERTPTDSRMARAMEEHAIRMAELSRQIDAHFGINGERPDSS